MPLKIPTQNKSNGLKNDLMSRRTTITLMMMLVYLISFAQQVKKKPLALDGKVFAIEIFREGKDKKWASDDLKFMVGSKLKPAGIFGDWGFGAACPYTCTTVDSISASKIYQFDCESKPNDKGQTLVWNGTVNGDDVEGTVERLRKGKVVDSFTFSGSIKQKKVPGDKNK